MNMRFFEDLRTNPVQCLQFQRPVLKLTTFNIQPETPERRILPHSFLNRPDQRIETSIPPQTLAEDVPVDQRTLSRCKAEAWAAASSSRKYPSPVPPLPAEPCHSWEYLRNKETIVTG